MNEFEFPRATNSLLSQEEKNFLDDIPDEGVKVVMETDDMDLKISFVPKDLSTTIYFEFAGDRATAVRDYYEMLFAYGVRTDPRVA